MGEKKGVKVMWFIKEIILRSSVFGGKILHGSVGRKEPTGTTVILAAAIRKKNQNPNSV